MSTMEKENKLEAEIINRGRGPEIRGTRITVYSIIDCLLECWPPERIAEWYSITRPQVEAAVIYIREHAIEVLREYLDILERSAQRRNPPELQAELDANHERFQELVAQIRAIKAQGDSDILDLIRKYRHRPKDDVHAGNHGGQ